MLTIRNACRCLFATITIVMVANGRRQRPAPGSHERGIAEYNRIHTASRPNLEISKVRDLFTIKHYSPKSVHEFNAEDMYKRWLRVTSEGNGVSSSAKR